MSSISGRSIAILAETVSRARIFTTRVARPDLLLLAALLHDIGKGRGVDHSVFGAELATQIGTRLGMWPSDIELLAKLVRHHLLLSIVATRQDLNDPQTIATVCEALDGDPVLLDVLHALTEADSLGNRARGVERLEGIAGRRPGAPQPDGDDR